MIRNLLILLTITFSPFAVAQSDDKSVVVMELFTSQGCSSCPPADELLEEIKNSYENNNVFVLSYHVDYWNRLGWKDPFSTEAFSDYQRVYARQFNSRSIYTPQLVINGSEHFTGSNRAKAFAAIEKYTQSGKSNTIKISDLKKDNNKIVLAYDVNGEDFNQITIALVVAKRITEIGRGENRNRTLTNANIVANRLILQQKTRLVELSIPDWVNASDELTIIAYTQNDQLATNGATKINI
ncbi:DUF1223 domain-containing protein [Aquimarina sp. SS2-1]|uniref:DUF1223 domain-containing protein n=1 Tax=Aquimarina besae TaxID=3342247 RepID=UPI003671F10B